MIDTTPLDEVLAVLRTLLPWLHEPHAEAQLAGVIARLERWGKEIEAHECEPSDEVERYYPLSTEPR